MVQASINNNGYSRTDIALTVIFTMGFGLYLGSLYLEFQSGAPHYIMMATAGSLISIAATFLATLRKRSINITIKSEE
ncbi:unnamed protein product [marine sediment metagenome]|uniref:Uncharacterized protein n=1 Tax=marine sediment metagenome TaxID=412755 RepID=X1F3T3_9ZZZZ